MKNEMLALFLVTLSLVGCIQTTRPRSNPQGNYTPQGEYLSKQEFKDMVRTGVAESTIEKALRKNKEGYYFTTEEILELRKWSASNRLIWVSMHPQSEIDGGVRKVKEVPSAKADEAKKNPSEEKREDKKATSKKEEAKTEPKTDTSKNPDEKKTAPGKKKYPSLFYYNYEKEGEEEIPPPAKNEKSTD